MKKAQIQLQESIFVLVIFVILVLISLIVFFKFIDISITTDTTNYLDTKFYSLTNTIPAMPELRCSNLGIDQECIDLDKLKAFQGFSKEYTNVFGQKNITLIMIYPGNENSYPIYVNKPRSVKNTRLISTYVSIYDSGQDKYKIGKLIVEEYR